MKGEAAIQRPEYETPSVRTFGEADILEKIGPAQAYTGNFPFGF